MVYSKYGSINRRNLVCILFATGCFLSVPNLSYADSKNPGIDTHSLGKQFGGWDHKNDTAAEFKWWGSEYRLYKPTFSSDSPEVLEVRVKLDHIKSGEADDHSQSNMLLGPDGTIISVHPHTEYGGGTQIPGYVLTPLEIGAGATTAAIVAAIGAVITGTSAVADGAITLGSASIPTIVVGTAATAAAASISTAIVVGGVEYAGHLTGKLGRWFDDGGSLMFPSATALALAATVNDFTPAAPQSATKLDFRGKKKFAPAMSEMFHDNVEWEDKDSSSVAEYDRSGHNYRTWHPEKIQMDAGGMMIASKIDHIKGGAKDDHGNILMYFNPGGSLAAVMFAVSRGGNDDSWTTGIMPNIPGMQDGDDYPIGLRLASLAKSKLVAEMGTRRGEEGLMLLPDVLFDNARAFINSMDVKSR